MKANITNITKEEINKWLLVDQLPIMFEDGTSVQSMEDNYCDDEKPYEIWENWDEQKAIGFYDFIQPLYDFVYNKLSKGVAIVPVENWEAMGWV